MGMFSFIGKLFNKKNSEQKENQAPDLSLEKKEQTNLSTMTELGNLQNEFKDSNPDQLNENEGNVERIENVLKTREEISKAKYQIPVISRSWANLVHKYPEKKEKLITLWNNEYRQLA